MYRHSAVSTSTVPWHHGPAGSTGPGPAYTSVVAQRKLGPHAEVSPVKPQSTQLASSPAQQPQQNQAKGNFPPNLRDYVQRSFAMDVQVPGIEREEVERMLKQVINDAASKNQIHEIQWEIFPLPQHLIQNQRARSLGIVPKSPPSSTEHSPSNEMSRKRKDPPATDLPPWRQNHSSLEDRISYPSPSPADRLDKRARKFQDASNSKAAKQQADQERRKQRFGIGKGGVDSTWTSREDTPESQGPVVGTCQKLEKRYFRLTSAPKPEAVRPLPVLEKALAHLKEVWKRDHNYLWMCDQLKSMRQDLTVQHIKTAFTVQVYEIHARIALESNDLGEYNQCQTQLRALYSQNLGGNPEEFLAYHILYLLYTRNQADVNKVLSELTPQDKLNDTVAFALDVRRALALGNYHKFFKLYLDARDMCAYIMDKFIRRERLAALANMCKAYKVGTLPLRFITEELGFESDHECASFICDHNGTELLQEQDGTVRFLASKAGNLFEAARAQFTKVDIDQV